MTKQPSDRRVVHAPALSTNPALAAARADLHAAVQTSDGEHHRRQNARSARDSAAEVLLNPTSTQLESTTSEATSMTRMMTDDREPERQ